jgi:hypothetical protein
MYVYYHDQQYVGTFSSKADALLMVKAKLFATVGAGPYSPQIFDGTDTIVDADRQELDLVRELGQIPGLITP